MWAQLSAQSAIQKQVLLQVLADDPYLECTKGRAVSVSTHSLIPVGACCSRSWSQTPVINNQTSDKLNPPGPSCRSKHLISRVHLELSDVECNHREREGGCGLTLNR